METIAHIILGGGIFLAIIATVALVLARAKKARQGPGGQAQQQQQQQQPAPATPPATPQITPLGAIVLIAIVVVIGWVLVSGIREICRQPEKPAWVEERMVEKTEVIGTDWKRLDPPRASFRWEVFKKDSKDRVWVTSTGWTEPYEVKNSPNSTIPHVKFDNLLLKADKENVEVEIYYFCR